MLSRVLDFFPGVELVLIYESTSERPRFKPWLCHMLAMCDFEQVTSPLCASVSHLRNNDNTSSFLKGQ